MSPNDPRHGTNAGMKAPFVFQAFWPVEDDSTPLRDLIATAHADLPDLYAQAHAAPAGRGEWRIVPGDRLPGSGGWTGDLLMWEIPACRVARTGPDSKAVALGPGQWARRGLVRVWVPDNTEEDVA